MGEDLFGFIGKPGFDLFTAYTDFDFSSFVFNLVFCATTATIVSGAMAERTKFLSYGIYSGVISALIGAKILGPRIGKFNRDKTGRILWQDLWQLRHHVM